MNLFKFKNHSSDTMYPPARKAYNATTSKYRQFLKKLDEGLENKVAFRVAETPVFLTDDFRDKLIDAGNEIIETLLQPDFKQLTERAIPGKWRVANENDQFPFYRARFWRLQDADGNIVPKLIELQGFHLYMVSRIVWDNILKTASIYPKIGPSILTGLTGLLILTC